MGREGRDHKKQKKNKGKERIRKRNKNEEGTRVQGKENQGGQKEEGK